MQETRQSLVALSSSELDRGRLPGNYSRLKLGCTADVDVHARLVAERLLSLDGFDGDDWLVTGPPIRVLPSAANLLAARVEQELRMHGRTGARLHPLRKLADLGRFPHGHFATLNSTARSAVLAHSAASLWLPDAALDGASVVVIDDVRVTGANETALRRFLRSSGVRRVIWLYVLELRLEPDDEPGTVEPRLNSLFLDDEGIADVLRDRELEPTTWLVWKLFDMDDDEFETVRGSIGQPLAMKIESLLLGEGFVPGAGTVRQWEYLVAAARASIGHAPNQPDERARR